MKRIYKLMFIVLLAAMFAACGDKSGPSMDTIKKSFRDEGYTITTASKNDLNKVAGATEGFFARFGLEWSHELYGKDSPEVDIKVWVYKFENKELAEEFANKTPSAYQIFSQQGRLVCRVQYHLPNEYTYVPDAPEAAAALKLFDDCF